MPLSPARDFGVQSYCFREFKDNKEVAGLIRKIGLNKTEICEVHANLKDVATFRKVVDTYREAGVSIVSLGVQTFEGKADERNWFECAKIAGAKHISAHFTVETFEKGIPAAVKWAEEFDMRIGIHCHGGYLFGGSEDVLRHLLKLGGDRIGITIDTAWCMQASPRYEPSTWVRETFKGRVYGVHYKDFVFDRRGRWSDVIVGTGNLNLPDFVNALEETNFNGVAVIEYEAEPSNPVPALIECVKQMRAV